MRVARDPKSRGKEEKEEIFAVSGREFPNKYFAVIRASLLFTVEWCVRVSPKRARFNLFILMCGYFDVYIFKCEQSPTLRPRLKRIDGEKKCRKCGRRMVAKMMRLLFFFFFRQRRQEGD